MANQYITRREAAALIDRVLLLIRPLEEYGSQSEMDVANRLRTIASEHGLEVPSKCTGEAHSNAHIDHCGLCLGYSWGTTGKKVKVL